MAVEAKELAALHRPLPLRLIFPLLFVGVYLAHLTLLRLPYYWDEAGYYIPAAWDFFRTGDVIPSSTLANAHPPLPSLYLALWWQSGFTPAVTRTAMCLVTAIALLAVYRLALLLNGRTRVAVATTLLTALYRCGLRKARWRMPICLPPRVPCGGWCLYLPGFGEHATYGRQRHVLPWPCLPRKQPSLPQ